MSTTDGEIHDSTYQAPGSARRFVYDFDEECSHRMGNGESADEIRVVVCPECGKMTTVDVKGCGNCGAVLDVEDERVMTRMMTLAKHLAQQWESDWLRELEAVLWSGGEA